MKDDSFDKLLGFLQRLTEARIHHRLSRHLDDAVSVEVWVPGEHWEVDFFADGEVYVERFRSDGHVDDESALTELFAKHSFAEPAAEPRIPPVPAKSVSRRKLESSRSSSKK
jgi:hypothetical protein